MNKRTAILKRAIAKAEAEEGSFPDGHLRISYSNNRPRYYKISRRGDTKGEYIVKERRGEATALAQKDYNRHFLKTAKAELGRLERDIRFFSEENADLLFQDLTENRKKLITPYILTDDQYVKEWLAEDFKPNPYMPEKRIYATNRGEMVRSKSEAILADMLYDMGIPYHIVGGPGMALNWWIAGIPYDLIHGVRNFVICLVLFKPLCAVMRRVTKEQ